MKKLENCIVDNCIPSYTSCTFWNEGDIEYLGICNGDPLGNVIWEIVGKLQDIAGEDLSNFDIDSLLDICNQKAPLEITLISILNIIKNNQVCLKDYITTLEETIGNLQGSSSVKVNLKCFADIDNIGNILSITREQLDQLVIDNLCNHKQRIESIEGSIINIKSQIDNINNTSTVEELNFSTCIDGTIKPTSDQVKTISSSLCNLQTATGTPTKIAQALSKVPADWNTKFGLISGWNLTPAQWAEQYGNLLLVVARLEDRVTFMENNCCAVSCDDVKVGFSAIYNETNDGIILKFNSGSGTKIPFGFTDIGSTVTLTDIYDNSDDYPITIANATDIEIPITGIDPAGDITININVKMSNGIITCDKCLTKIISRPVCDFCTITATDKVTIVYQTCSSIEHPNT